MATKNLKKVLASVDLGDDELMNKNPVNFFKAIAYKKRKVVSKARNALFAKLYAELRLEGHGKKDAKTMVKARLKSEVETQLGHAGQDEVQS